MALNHEHGFLIVQDFGDLLLQDLIGKNEDDFLYKEALSCLVKIQSCTPEIIIILYNFELNFTNAFV